MLKRNAGVESPNYILFIEEYLKFIWSDGGLRIDFHLLPKINYFLY